MKLKDDNGNIVEFKEVIKIKKSDASKYLNKGYRIFKSGFSYYACK